MARAGFPAVAIPPSAARDVQIAVQNIRARLEAIESSYAPSKTVNAQIASVSAQIGTSSSSSGIADALSNGITYGRENASWVQVLPRPIASSTNAAYDIVFYDGTSAALISSALTFNPSTKALSITGTATFTTTGVGQQVNVFAPSGYSTSFWVSGNGNTTVGGIILQQDTTNTGYFRNTGGSLNIGAGTQNAITVNTSGNVTVNAPSNGTTLTTTQQGTGNAQVWNATGNTTNGAANVAFDVNGNVYVQSTVANTRINFGSYASNTTLALVSNGSGRLTIGSAGNVTVNAPGSGVGLSVNGIAGQPALNVIGGNTATSVSTMYLQDASSARGTEIYFAASAASTTAKYLRVNSGNFQIINNAYSAVLLSVDDSGNTTVTGNLQTGALTVTGNENVTGTLTVTGDVFAPNILNFTASASAPGSPNVGDRWVNTSNGVQYTWFNDGSGNQWVQFT